MTMEHDTLQAVKKIRMQEKHQLERNLLHEKVSQQINRMYHLKGWYILSL